MQHAAPNNGGLSLSAFLALVAGLIGSFWIVSRFLFAKITSLMCGWKKVALEFPARQVKETGQVYKMCTGEVGLLRSRGGGFDVQLCLEGLAVTPAFARHSPIFIPWSDVRRIEVHGSSVVDLKIDSERSMSFWLPHDAVETIRARAPFLTVH
jgi:hypothetical protein